MRELFHNSTVRKNLITLKFPVLRFFLLSVGLLFTIGLFQSCKEKIPTKKTLDKQELSRKELVAEVLELYYDDHKYQRMLSVFQQLNSECRNVGINRKNWENDETRLAFKVFWENAMRVQYLKNTKRLIAITEKHGFPGMESLGHDVPVFIVFVHAPEQYIEKVRKLIKKEYKEGRVSEFEKDYIFWHLNGRKEGTRPPGIPYPINYRGGVEIFRGALINEMYGLSQSYKSEDTLNIATLSQQELNREELIAEVKKIYFDDQKYRRMIDVFEVINNECKGGKINPYNSENDETRLAFWLFREDIIEPQDRKNTKRLIALTKKYGFPGMESLGHDIPVFMVFAHTPYIYKYFNEVRTLIEQEYKAGRISKFAKDYILWHIEGREAMPPALPDTIDYSTDIEIFKEALENDKESKSIGS